MYCFENSLKIKLSISNANFLLDRLGKGLNLQFFFKAVFKGK